MDTGVSQRAKMSAPSFGAWLTKKREGRPAGIRSLEALAIDVRKHVAQYGIKVNKSSIQKWEAGRIPSLLVLYAFAQIFKLPFLAVVTLLVNSLEVEGHGRLVEAREGTNPVAELEQRLESLERRDAAVASGVDVALRALTEVRNIIQARDEGDR